MKLRRLFPLVGNVSAAASLKAKPQKSATPVRRERRLDGSAHFSNRVSHDAFNMQMEGMRSFSLKTCPGATAGLPGRA